jgi:peptidyl-prolyl cis-trans isomerase D
MLQKLHEKIKGWVAGVIIAAVSATFVLWGVQYYLQSAATDSVVAKINGEKITLKQFTTNFQQLQHQYMMKTGHVLSDAQNQELKQYALQNLILNSVLLQTAEHAGFKVGADQVNALITSMPEFQENGHFSPLRYQQLLYANSLTPYAFMTQLSNEITMHQIESGIQNTAFVLPNEVQQDYALTHQQRDFGYVIVPQTHFTQAVKITNQMLTAYYQQHHEEFKSPEKVSIEYVELSPQTIGAHVNVSDAEIKQYYQDNLANYRAQKKNSLAAAAADIKKALLQQKINAILTKDSDRLSDIAYTNPTTLKPAADALHLQLQTSPLFSQQGGASGIITDPKIIAVAFSDDVLAQGNNSDPIELKDGSLVILRVKEHQPSRILSQAEMAPHIQQILQQQMAQAQAALAADKIANAINKQMPTKVVAPYQLSWQQFTNVSRDSKLIPQPIIAAAFSLTKNNAVTTIALTNGDSAVIQLHAIKATDSKQQAAKNLQAIQQKLSSDSGQMEYQLYVRSAHDHAKVKVMATATNANAGAN